MTPHVATVEDDPRYQASLERLFTQTDVYRLAGAFGSAEAALEALESEVQRPWDLILMDIELPGMNGIDATRRIKQTWPDSKIIILTVFEEPRTVLEAICAGADGYLLKSSSGREILEQLDIVRNGGGSLTPGVARTVLDLVRDPFPVPRRQTSPPARVELTPREQEVLRALMQGLAYKQVASSLDISLNTVRSYIKTIYQKLQVHGVAEAITRAIRDRLI